MRAVSATVHFLTGAGVVSNWAMAFNKVWSSDVILSEICSSSLGRDSRDDFQRKSRSLDILYNFFFLIGVLQCEGMR